MYLRNLPVAHNVTPGFEINAGTNGQELFQAKGCAGCHSGTLALESRLKDKTLTDIAVAMWNHAPRMAGKAPSLDLEDMRSIVSYLWARQFFQESGNAAAGRKIFVAKRCSVCHSEPSSGAPKLPQPGRLFDGATMVSALWSHGLGMMKQMEAKGIPWPRFRSGEMSEFDRLLKLERIGEMNAYV